MKRLISEIYSRLKYMLLSEEGEKFKPTTEWMQKWYEIMNDELFDGDLGPCILTTFTSGRGASGRTLGRFVLTGNNLKYNKETRRIFQGNYEYSGTYITRDNFAQICKPLIALNANYRGTQDAWLNTLVHEMCHYYVKMFGYNPKQSHGVEFRNIASRVAYKSNGKITIQRLATAEEMNDYELDDAIKQKNDQRQQKLEKTLAQRKANTLLKTMALVVVLDNDQVRLLTTTSETLLFEIGDLHNKRKNIKYFGSCKNADLIEFLRSKGYKGNSKKYRFWDITNNKPLLDELLKYSWTNYLGTCDTLEQALNIEKQEQVNPKPQQEEGLLSRYRIVEDGDGYNILDAQNKYRRTFGKPVDSIRYDKEDDVFYFTMGTHEFTGTPGNWVINC